MPDVTISLGNIVKKMRNEKSLTQREVANLADIDVRTVLNIENYKGNPKIEVLFPLIRVLGIDPMLIFYPEIQREDAYYRQMQILLSECDEKELAALLPICRTVLSTMRDGGLSIIEADYDGE